jgi:hypothetical protein
VSSPDNRRRISGFARASLRPHNTMPSLLLAPSLPIACLLPTAYSPPSLPLTPSASRPLPPGLVAGKGRRSCPRHRDRPEAGVPFEAPQRYVAAGIGASRRRCFVGRVGAGCTIFQPPKRRPPLRRYPGEKKHGAFHIYMVTYAHGIRTASLSRRRSSPSSIQTGYCSSMRNIRGRRSDSIGSARAHRAGC